MQHDVVARVLASQIEGAQRFAAAEKSDPFAFARAMTHINNGKICRPNQHGEPCTYDAEPYTEMRRLPDGREYSVVVYRNVRRP